MLERLFTARVRIDLIAHFVLHPEGQVDAYRDIDLMIIGEDALIRFYKIIADLDLEVVPVPTDEDLAGASESVATKDAHVLAGARKGRATHLVTLDRKHFLGDDQREEMLPIVARTPGELLRL